MTTRAERLAKAERLARSQLEKQRDRLNRVKSAQREEERKALTKRRLLVGAMAEESGLFVLDDSTLAGLFSLLASLTSASDPVAVLESLLASPGSLDAESVDGMAQAADGVSPTG